MGVEIIGVQKRGRQITLQKALEITGHWLRIEQGRGHIGAASRPSLGTTSRFVMITTSELSALNDPDLFALMQRHLNSAVIGDILDQMGFRRQFLPYGIAPLAPATTIAGRAMPVLEQDIPSDQIDGTGAPTRNAFGLMFQALDSLKSGEIYIASTPSLNYALWGGLMTTRAKHLNAAGAILNGFARDGDEIARLGFPVFCRGLYAQDQAPRGKVVDMRCALQIGQARIEPGDLMFGDREGVLVIPRAGEREAIARSFEKLATENKVADAIRAGMGTVEAFDTFGVM
jgi:4-hydroxy-4-methyl-2-oxoglutarate aldolase